jgi:hypothetical protein
MRGNREGHGLQTCHIRRIREGTTKSVPFPIPSQS